MQDRVYLIFFMNWLDISHSLPGNQGGFKKIILTNWENVDMSSNKVGKKYKPSN